MNLIELRNNLPTEIDCIEYAENIRWNGRIRCVYYESDKLGERNADNRYHCKDCEKSFSVKTGTVLHDSRLPLSTWFSAVSVITDAKKGMSAKQLERNIGVSYETAWNMYHRLRDLMEWETPKQDSLSGIVEMDETYVGGKPRRGNPLIKGRKIPALDEKIASLKEDGWNLNRKRGNSAKIDFNSKHGKTDKIRVTGIVQRNGDVIAQVMQSITHGELKEMVEKYVEEGKALLITDQAAYYKSMHKIIDHISIDHSRLYSYRGVNTNSIESFWAIVKRGIMGQYHQVSLKYLPNYVAEFVFKYNNRKDEAIMFDILVENLLTEI